ncbi:MAG TPA: hypothetical protein VGP93_19155 [Polyangiaceae bacterium]|nr:hypothetical protein [Polyangiaceae bacterium]
MRNRKVGFLGMLALTLTLGVARKGVAQEETTGFELGFRVAYGIPLGKLENGTGTASDSQLNDGISGQIPLWLDLGYRATPELMIGGYFSYGFGLIGSEFSDNCDHIDSCTVRDLRLGADLQYHLQPQESVDPWLGAGFGYEWLTFSFSDSGTDLSATVRGWEFVSFQAGFDFPSGPTGGIGPFVAFSLGQYDRTSVACDGSCNGLSDDSQEIDDKALHQWLFLGVRGTFVL